MLWSLAGDSKDRDCARVISGVPGGVKRMRLTEL